MLLRLRCVYYCGQMTCTHGITDGSNNHTLAIDAECALCCLPKQDWHTFADRDNQLIGQLFAQISCSDLGQSIYLRGQIRHIEQKDVLAMYVHFLHTLDECGVVCANNCNLCDAKCITCQ